MMPDDEILTVKEAGYICGVSFVRISRAINSGELKATKADDGSYQIRCGDLRAWFNPIYDRAKIKRKLLGGKNSLSVGCLNDNAYDALLEVANENKITINEFIRALIYDAIKERL